MARECKDPHGNGTCGCPDEIERAKISSLGASAGPVGSIGFAGVHEAAVQTRLGRKTGPVGQQKSAREEKHIRNSWEGRPTVFLSATMTAALSPSLNLTAKLRRTGLFALILFLAGYLLWTAPLPIRGSRLSRPIPANTAHAPSDRTPSLGVAQSVYMLSLPSRSDRRVHMESLRKALDSHWTYVDALQSTNELTQRIWEWVMRVREGKPTIFDSNDLSRDSLSPGQVQFSWPDHIDRLALSPVPIDFWADTVWSAPIMVRNPTPYRPTTCAMDDYRIPDFNFDLPEHLILTRARIACWYSHISVLHNIANNKNTNLDSTYIILEDDIDMERDVSHRIDMLWKSLPSDWDMVFLGTFITQDSHDVSLYCQTNNVICAHNQVTVGLMRKHIHHCRICTQKLLVMRTTRPLQQVPGEFTAFILLSSRNVPMHMLFPKEARDGFFYTFGIRLLPIPVPLIKLFLG